MDIGYIHLHAQRSDLIVQILLSWKAKAKEVNADGKKNEEKSQLSILVRIIIDEIIVLLSRSSSPTELSEKKG